MSKSSQALLVEAMQIVGDPVQRTETKRKTRTVEAGGYAKVEQHEFEDRKKPKQLTKEEKIAQIFNICGVTMPSEGKTKNFGDGTFVSGSAGYVKHQYNTNKALLDAVSSMVVGMNVQDFLKVAVQKIPAAQKEFSELYGEEALAVKIGRGMMAMYKAAPRKVKATIIEGLVKQHGLTFKDLQEGLGVTRWQWNNAQLALQELASGKKQKAPRGVAMKVDAATVEKFVDFCLRPDNIQDVAFGFKGCEVG